MYQTSSKFEKNAERFFAKDTGHIICQNDASIVSATVSFLEFIY